MNFKMIASDLDGTLLHDLKIVSKENYLAISEFAEKGGYVVPTSGRCFYEMPEELREYKDVRFCISSNGAVVTDTKTGECDEELISPETYSRIMELTLGYESFHSIHFEGYGYILKKNDSKEVSEYYNLNKYYFAHYHEMCRKLDSWDGAFDGGRGVEMVSVFFHSRDELEECVEKLNAIGGLHVTSSVSCNVEIVSKKATKGEGVRRLAKKLGISEKEIIGVGDSPNDIALLECAGLPLAVSNADGTLKEKAAAVICSHTEHILRYILEHYVSE